MSEHKSAIESLAKEYFSEILDVRRHLHRHPELSNQEHQTAAFICQKLEEYGIPFTAGVAGTGVVGLIRGNNPESRCIALRADMDALPVTEANEVEYKSCFPGIMHACGHDVHMACLLGAAKILNAIRHRFEGTVKLIFQPSEETYPGGAIRMIGEGVLENPSPEVVIAQHVINTLEAGKVGFRAGAYMASTDEIFITIHGKGGHAATPAQVVDPIVIASHIVIALQQIVSRHADPVMPTVVSIGRITGAGRTNVIPDEVNMEGTVRTYDEKWRKEVHRRIEQMAKGIAASMGASCTVRIDGGYPFLFNDPPLTTKLQEISAEYLGKENVIELPQRMTAEDFAYFAIERPACLFRLGIANEEKGISANLHTATFNVDESCLQTGMGHLAWLAFSLLHS